MIGTDPKSESAVKICNKSFTWGIKTKTPFQEKREKKEKERKEKEKQAKKSQWSLTKKILKKIRDKDESDEEKEECKCKEEKICLDPKECKCENLGCCMQSTKISEVIHLKDISLDIKKGEFVCIIGEVGSGKTNFFNALLGDMFNITDSIVDYMGGLDAGLVTEEDKRKLMYPIIQHNTNLEEAPIMLNGSVSYSQQTPWIQSKTIRENILFEAPLDKARYYDTIKVCELENDLK